MVEQKFLAAEHRPADVLQDHAALDFICLAE
jgi:hypothetical protein